MAREVYVITDLDTGWGLTTENREEALKTWWTQCAEAKRRQNLTFMRTDIPQGRGDTPPGEVVWILGLRSNGHLISGGARFHPTPSKPGGACELPPERPHYKGEM